ncbi:MAG: hypothetical protein PHN88_03360 [Ignavibacteria bacterium]|nr:hypothetical protein [Ignavibacteria bacterium]
MNIQKTLFQEFSCLLNYDIENQIRKNNDCLKNINIEELSEVTNEEQVEIDNLLYKFYLSLTKMFSFQNQENTLNKNSKINFNEIRTNYSKIINQNPLINKEAS